MGILWEIISEIGQEINSAFAEPQKKQTMQQQPPMFSQPFDEELNKRLYQMTGWGNPPTEKAETPVEGKSVEGEYKPQNVPISRMKTELELHSEKQAKHAEKAVNHTHSHPAHVGSKVENRPSYVGSLGGNSTEGCQVHANERYVQSPKMRVSSDSITIAEMRKAVIMSEILGKPKAKR